ncbi:hypothetical protein D3C81_769700 [compost metagenome]
MGQGAAGEQRWVGGVDAHRVADLAVQEEGLADVIEQHEQNHQAAQGINALQALGEGGGGGAGACHGGSQAGGGCSVKCYLITFFLLVGRGF